MDDTNQQTQQVQNTQNQNQQSTQVNTLVDFTKQPNSTRQDSSQTQQPTGTGHPKELEPMPSRSSPTEFMKPFEQHVELEPEVTEAGVEELVQEPYIAQEEKDLGIEYAKETMPIEKEPIVQNPFPMSQAQAQQIVKGPLITKDTSNPMVWLALLIMRQYQILEKQNESK